jgi:hypothetical protein
MATVLIRLGHEWANRICGCLIGSDNPSKECCQKSVEVKTGTEPRALATDARLNDTEPRAVANASVEAEAKPSIRSLSLAVLYSVELIQRGLGSIRALSISVIAAGIRDFLCKTAKAQSKSPISDPKKWFRSQG